MNAEQRVNLMFKQSGMTKKDWSLIVGTHENTIISIIKGRKSATPAILKKIAEASPEYNYDWVTRGFGAMLTDGTPAPSVANSVTVIEGNTPGKVNSFESFLLAENEYLKQKIDQLIAIMSNQSQPLGKLNLQSEAGYATEIMLFPKLASVA